MDGRWSLRRRRARRALDRATGRDLREQGARRYSPPARRGSSRSRGRDPLAGTARRDLGEKLRLYAESGVVEYWVIDPILETFEFLENTPAGFRVRLPEGAVYRSAAIPGLELDLEAFWRALPS